MRQLCDSRRRSTSGAASGSISSRGNPRIRCELGRARAESSRRSRAQAKAEEEARAEPSWDSNRDSSSARLGRSSARLNAGAEIRCATGELDFLRCSFPRAPTPKPAFMASLRGAAGSQRAARLAPSQPPERLHLSERAASRARANGVAAPALAGQGEGGGGRSGGSASAEPARMRAGTARDGRSSSSSSSASQKATAAGAHVALRLSRRWMTSAAPARGHLRLPLRLPLPLSATPSGALGRPQQTQWTRLLRRSLACASIHASHCCTCPLPASLLPACLPFGWLEPSLHNSDRPVIYCRPSLARRIEPSRAGAPFAALLRAKLERRRWQKSKLL